LFVKFVVFYSAPAVTLALRHTGSMTSCAGVLRTHFLPAVAIRDNSKVAHVGILYFDCAL